jgi:plasmid stability protein
MRNILVRDVPDDVHAVLADRAARRGQSLQQYLAGELARLAERPALDEVLDRIDRRRGGRVPLTISADTVAEERAAR